MKKVILTVAFFMTGVVAVSAQEIESPKQVEPQVKTTTTEQPVSAEDEAILKAELEKKEKELEENLQVKKDTTKNRKMPADVLNNKTIEAKRSEPSKSK